MPFLPRRSREAAPAHAVEATPAELFVAGASYGGGMAGIDPIDGDTGFRRLGQGANDLPPWSLEKARGLSLYAYRANPMGRAIVDTYTSFCVGDSGVSLQCTDPEVRTVAEEFWNDPANALDAIQEMLLRGHMLDGETALEMMVGVVTAVCRFSYVDPWAICGVDLYRGNPLWPGTVRVRVEGGEMPLEVARVDDVTRLREGDVQFWPSWKARPADRRGTPFLSPVLDWLDSYDRVLSNLIDRTALARYLVWDVEIDGANTTDIEKFIKDRGGSAAPRSGTIEVHNDKVKWEPKSATTGSYEDTNTTKAVLTEVAAGAGLAKTWLAEPEDANRATSLTMAEPVRRRVGGVQKMWLGQMTELVRYAVDQAVRVGRLPPMVTMQHGERTVDVPAADTVTVTGPEIAAADASVNAEVLVKLSQGLVDLVAAELMTPDAAQIAAKTAWENFMGIPYSPELDRPDGSKADDVAGELNKAAQVRSDRRASARP